ncbi:MAG: DUF58 domain-containing protein [Chloroflexi bacterium]|nr:DUF58 domain-containing protein [Chloroflexota bacterium]
MKKRILISLALVVLLVIALTSSFVLLWRLWLVFAAMVLTGLLWALLSARGIRLETGPWPKRCQMGDSFDEELTLVNTSSLPKPFLHLEAATPWPGRQSGISLGLMPRGTHTWRARVDCQRRGEFSLGQFTLTARDPFGLFSSKRQLGEPQSVTVCPKTVELPCFEVAPLANAKYGPAQWLTELDGTSIGGVREYTSGDSLRHIHWRSTARTGRLQVKVFDADRPRYPIKNAWLLIDMCGAAYQGDKDGKIADLAVTAAASVSKRCVDIGCRVGLVAQGDRPYLLAPEAGEQHLWQVLTTLAVMKPEGGEPVDHVVLNELGRFADESAIVIVTPSINEHLATALRQLGKRQRLVSIVQVSAEDTSGDISPAVRTMAVSGVHTYTVHSEEHLPSALDSSIASLGMARRDTWQNQMPATPEVSRKGTADKPPDRTSLRQRLWPGAWPQWVSLLLLLFTLGIAIHSIEQSGWVAPQPSLKAVLAIAVLLNTALLYGRLPTAVALLPNLAVGLVVTIWQMSPWLIVPETAGLSSRLLATWHAFSQFVISAMSNQDATYFALFLVVTAWLVGSVATWSLLRRRNPWVPALLGVIALLINIRYNTDGYYIYFPLYIFTAMLLISVASLRSRVGVLAQRVGERSPAMGTLHAVTSTLVIAVLIVGGSWFSPEMPAGRLATALAERLPWGDSIQASALNVFAAVEPKQPTMWAGEQTRLGFNGVNARRTEVQFVITVPQEPAYWWIRRYDNYQPWGWTSEPTGERTLGRGTLANGDSTSTSQGTELTFTVVNKMNTEVVINIGELSTANTSVLLKLMGGDSDVVAVTTPRMLSYGEQYTVTARIPSATPEELAQTGQDYPRLIATRYLQLPPSLPKRVRQLARIVTANQPTPYEKAEAVRSYLATMPYRETGSAPPEGIDGVDYFLFTDKTGNCFNFASAMAVMLRALGVPARISSGYLPRETNTTDGTVNIRASDYHARTEAYFPEYGWIEFEATPGFRRADGVAIPEDSPPEATTTEQSPAAPIDLTAIGAILDEADLALLEDILPGEAPPPAASLDEAIPSPEEFAEAKTYSDGSRILATVQKWGKPLFVLLVSALVLFLTLPRAIAVIRQRTARRSRDLSCRLYGRMSFWALLAGLGPLPSQTPAEYGARLAIALPSQTEAIHMVTEAFVQTRYGRHKGQTFPEADLRRSWAGLFRALLKRLARFPRKRRQIS